MTITHCINTSYCGWWTKSLINFSYAVWKVWQSPVPSLNGKLYFYWRSSKKTIKIKGLLQLVWLPWSCSSIPLDDTNCKSCFQVCMEWNCSFIEAICWLMSHESWVMVSIGNEGAWNILRCKHPILVHY